MNSLVNHVMIVPPRLDEIARVPHDTRIGPVTCGLFRTLGGGVYSVTRPSRTGLRRIRSPFAAGHRGEASAPPSSGTRTAVRGIVAPLALEDDMLRTGEVRSAVADQEPDVLERLKRRNMSGSRHGHRRGRHSAPHWARRAARSAG